MKRIITLVLAVVMALTACFALASCGQEKSDWQTVEEKGYFYCGITLYAPMNYYNDQGDLVGFDTEFAKAVAKELGVEAKFVTIDWGSKYLELNNGAIDFIWNGFTYGNESDGTSRADYVDFTYSYLNNSQCIVTKADALTTLNTKEAFASKKGVAEGGSAGVAVVEELSDSACVNVDAQTDALREVLAGTADFAVIDIVMARAMVGTGDYTALSINTAYEPEGEVYAIGCRKGSDMTAKVNEAIAKLSADGTLATIAEKYGLTNALIPNIGK